MTQSRRTFLKSSTAAAAVSLAAPKSTFAALASDYQANGPLSEFGYAEIELMDGPLREQFRTNHIFYLSLDEDMLLKPYRQRAGLPAPGEDMGGWYDWVDGKISRTFTVSPRPYLWPISLRLVARLMPLPATSQRRKRFSGW